ncbi:MAG TPA: hypothetical protein VK760_12925, partial [Candidatus Acidoferrales bacterium]|nr:hypothetical protein [Candidatus Acidoferrales bacterium]
GGRIYLFVAMILAALRFWQVPFSAPADADAYLVHLAAIAPFEHAGTWGVFGLLSASFHSAAPGWFPAGPLPLALWLSGLSAAAIKSVQYVLLVLSFGLFAFVARKLLGSGVAAIAAVIVALCAWQFRTIHDPAVGTSLLTSWTAVVVLAAFACWLEYRESGKPPALFLCYATLVLAVLNGPVAWGVCALLAIVALRSPRRAAAIGICGILVAAAFAIVASGPLAAPWQHGGGFVANVAAQAFAALPASFRAIGNLPVAHVADLYFGIRYVDDRFVLIPPITLAGWAFALAAAVAMYVASLGAARDVPARRGEVWILGAGLWLVPAIVLGAPSEWRAGVPLGQAFDGVYFEYLGLAVLATYAIVHLSKNASPATRLVPSLLALAAFVLSYGNARGDAYVLAVSARLDEPGQAVARAARAGFLNELPDGAIVVPSPSLLLPTWSANSVADPKYALFEYTGKRYSTQTYDRAAASPQTWILATTRDRGIPVTLWHWSAGGARNPLVDRAFGFTVDRNVWAQAAGLHRGVRRTVAALPGGFAIDARRLCGDVPPAMAFAPSRPSVVWGAGFVPLGPLGYSTGPTAPVQSLLGTYLTFFPKIYLGTNGVATIVPSACPPGTIYFKFVVAAWKPSRLVVRTPSGVAQFSVDDTAPTIVLHTKIASRAPFRLSFSTDAPAADWESNLFRYERDRPFKRRLVVELSDLWETP